MTDVDNVVVEEEEYDEEAEFEAAALSELKARATKLGVKFHPSIKAETLSEKVREHLEAEEIRLAEEAERAASGIPAPDLTPIMEKVVMPTKAIHRPARTRAEAEALVRVIITSMDPLKKSFKGEIFTVGNSVIPTMRNFVPFGAEWHIPRIMLNVINEKYFTTFDRSKDLRGREIITPRQVKAYAVQVLEPLTGDELEALKQRQIIEANGS